MKSFAGASENERTGKIKVSRDGSESGSYMDKDQLAAVAKSAWVGVVSLAAEQGAQAQGLRVGNVPATIKPHVHASQFDEASVERGEGKGSSQSPRVAPIPIHTNLRVAKLGKGEQYREAGSYSELSTLSIHHPHQPLRSA